LQWLRGAMGRYWDGTDVYFGDDEDRASFEATHTSGFHIEYDGDCYEESGFDEELE